MDALVKSRKKWTFVLFFVLMIAGKNCKLLEAGFDDGPFYGKKIDLASAKIKVKESIPFRSGQLQALELNGISGSILSYYKDNKFIWAYELQTSEQMENTFLTEIRNLRVSSGIFRDRIDFIGVWTYGAERGKAYIWKWGGLQYFYLSW